MASTPPKPEKAMRRRSKSLVLSDQALAQQERWKKSLFEQHCKPGSNVLVKEDLSALLKKMHLPPSHVDEIFGKVDKDGDGRIDYNEFSLYVDSHEAQLRNSFAELDAEGNGRLSKGDIQLLLDRQQMSCRPERLDEIFALIDSDGSGKISYDKYRAFFALVDPDDLLRSLSDSASFGDLPVGAIADTQAVVRDTKALVRRLSAVRGPAVQPAPPPPTPTAAAKTSPSWLQQLLPGGLAGVMAQTIVQPVETLKVRLQAETASSAPPRYRTLPNALRLVTSEEGVFALWKGMAPSALRELSYSTLRFGLYKPIKGQLGATNPRETPLWKMIAAGGAAGGIASALANPTDLLKTRMQNDAKGSRSMLSHMGDIYRAGGVLGFWRGATTTVVRAVLLGAVKMATYDSAKLACEDYLGLRRGTSPNTVAASLLVSANVVLCTSPADYLRTQVMLSATNEGLLSVATQRIQAHGPLVLWRGWHLQYARFLPYGTLQFVFMERIAAMMGTTAT